MNNIIEVYIDFKLPVYQLIQSYYWSKMENVL